jgi:hypothetical protein
MHNRRHIVIAAVAGVAVAAVLTFFAVSYREALFPPDKQAEAEAPANPNALNIPSVDTMCKTLGAAEGDPLKQCQADENAAAEFVIAWMGFNGFLSEGGIDLQQIQFTASLDQTDPLLPADSDPSVGGSPDIDPVTGTPVGGAFGSPAQLALYCLGSTADWMRMHECISQNDPSTSLEAAITGGGVGSEYDPSAGLGDPGGAQ